MKKKKKNLLTKIWSKIVDFFTEEDEEITPNNKEDIVINRKSKKNKKKENFLRKIINFFTEENKEEETEGEISIATLTIIFLIGVLIIGTFYVFFGSSKEDRSQFEEDISNITGSDQSEIQEAIYDNLEIEVEILNDSLNACLDKIKLYEEKLVLNEKITADYNQRVESLELDYYNLKKDYEKLELNYSLILLEINRFNTTFEELYNQIYPYEYKTNFCKNCFVYLSLVENNIMNIKYSIPHPNKKKWQIFLHKIKERIFHVDVDYGWVYVNKYLPNVDWSNFSAIKLFLKSDIPGGSFELHFKEQDGDEWFYFDNQILSKEGWIGIKIPFTQFTQPKWASYGNSKQDLNSITEIGITFTSFGTALNKTVYFSVVNEDIFSLS